jgi:hypothetical protein
VLFIVLAIALIAGGLISWRWRGDSEQVNFLAVMSAGAAALVFLAIAFQTAATLILPGCGG